MQPNVTSQHVMKSYRIKRVQEAVSQTAASDLRLFRSKVKMFTCLICEGLMFGEDDRRTTAEQEGKEGRKEGREKEG